MKWFHLLICIVFVWMPELTRADVTLPKLVSDGMVLQRDVPVNVWGWADAGEKITISFKGKSYRAITTSQGKWSAILSPSKAGGPFSMEIRGKNKVTITDILVGDVWFCSGQSNMVLNMERVKEKYTHEINNAHYPQIRNFLVPTYSDVTKVHDDLPNGKWVTTTPETIFSFGAVAYFFAKAVYEKHKVPVGIINSSVGGTPIEAWVSKEGLKIIPGFAERISQYSDSVYIKQVVNAKRNVPVVTGWEEDKGLTGSIKWYDTTFHPKDWKRYWLPGYWEDQGVKDLDGVVWFRKEIDIPHSLSGKPARLFMGRIVDADQAYVNGVAVGNVTYQYPPRRYVVPEGVLKEGRNIIVIRVTNTNGKGGFVPDKTYSLVVENRSFDLRGDWEYQVGQVFRKSNDNGGISFSAQSSPTGLFNTMVAPIIPYTIRGINWYQGESNVSQPHQYGKLLSTLINDWRMHWAKGDIPFAFVQLANFMEVQYSPTESYWAILREEQRKTLSVPHTAMVVSIDLGEWNDIHPLNKKDVGERLALAMEHLAYGDDRLVYVGPMYKSQTRENNKIILTFSNVGTGLIAKGGGELQYFEIAGLDGNYLPAKAKIEGDHVVVWCDEITQPLTVRYAWADNPERANLYNKEGLPASPFKTEDE